ncbi:hypothetical protein FXO38_06942 [Capsicum annuum]|uniref:Uncharacterized protein n=1 Tax=Capsicum annuum TaxID=4072 RepID=A0A2G2YWJ3_CAPAN|nr:hypothetical protein FXO38_06942 [Capsicum annuum]PHT74109.1 hypothetical protein T459_21386 [Capsicum annuum]
MNSANEDAIELNLLYREFSEYFVWSIKDKMWSYWKKKRTIGRVVTCHPTEEERYYLRLLLMNVRGPKSYKDFRTVEGQLCSTFRECVEKQGLLHSNNCLIGCILEATSYQMPHSLRRLFATLLVYCNPVNPRELWKQFEEPMSEDFKLIPNIGRKDIQFQVLNQINDILHSMGVYINEYKLVQETIRLSKTAKEAKEVHFERTIVVSEEYTLLYKKLNKDQFKAYNTIMERIFSYRAGAFSLMAQEEQGKNFYIVLYLYLYDRKVI